MIATPPVVSAAPLFTLADLADRGIHAHSRVGSCIQARRFGVIELVVDESNVLVRWDNGDTEWASWLHIAPTGYVVEA
jgi:hypothetical protein